MGRVRGECPYMDVRFLAIARPFLANFDEIVHGTSEDYHLSGGCHIII